MKKAGLALVLILLATTANAQLIVPKGSTVQLLIPAAGSVQGVGGTFFRSDITLINYRTTAQLVRFRWLPENAPGTDVAPIDVTIAASSGIVSEDFVTSILGKSGLGALTDGHGDGLDRRDAESAERGRAAVFTAADRAHRRARADDSDHGAERDERRAVGVRCVWIERG